MNSFLNDMDPSCSEAEDLLIESDRKWVESPHDVQKVRARVCCVVLCMCVDKVVEHVQFMGPKSELCVC